MKRPTSVTVIAWVLIVMSSLSLVGIMSGFNNPQVQELMAKSALPVSLQYVLGIVGLLFSIVAGIFMLKAKNWARWLYVIWSVFGFLVSLATSPMKMMVLPGVVVFVIIVFFLFRPKANEYFSTAQVSDSADAA